MKKCDYCGAVVESLRPTPFLCDAGKAMCEECWEATREEFVALNGIDIGAFEEEEARDGRAR